MISPELTSYIKTSKEKGLPLDVIKSNLLSADWGDADIYEALAALDASVPPEPSVPTPAPTPIPMASSVSSTLPKKDKFLVYGIGLVVLLSIVAGVVYAYDHRISFFGVFSPSYSESNFMSSLLVQSSKIKTSSYTVSASLDVGPRDSETAPFTLKPLDEEFIKRYQDDTTRIANLQAILLALRNHPDSYPGTLKEIKSVGNSLYGGVFSLIDPVTSQEYEYVLVDGGKNFNLTATLETREAISEIRKSYSFNKEDILISGQRVTLTKSSPLYIYVSANPPKPLFVELSEYAKHLPDEFSADVSFSAQTDLDTADLADWRVNFDANGDFGDLIYKINVDALKKGAEYYLRVNNIPSIFLGSFSHLKGDWIKITSEKKDDESGDAFQSYDPISSIAASFTERESKYKESRAESIEFLKKAIRFADEEKLVAFKNKPTKEKVNGQNLTRYDLQINRDAVLPFYRKLVAVAALTEYSKAFFEDSGMLTYLETPEFDEIFDYYQANTSLSMFMDKDGFPVITRYSFRMIPPDSAEQLKDKQANLVFSLNISDINSPLNIEAPLEAKDLKDIPVVMTARSKSTNASIKANLLNMLGSAELYYDKHRSYGATVNNSCVNTSGTLFGEQTVVDIITRITKTMNESGIGAAEINCYSNKKAWAVSARLITVDQDDGYWCVDSVGTNKLVKKRAISAVCPK